MSELLKAIFKTHISQFQTYNVKYERLLTIPENINGGFYFMENNSILSTTYTQKKTKKNIQTNILKELERKISDKKMIKHINDN